MQSVFVPDFDMCLLESATSLSGIFIYFFFLSLACLITVLHFVVIFISQEKLANILLCSIPMGF